MTIQGELDLWNADRPEAAADAAVLLTIPHAARMLAISRSTAYELIAAGQLEVVHIGRSARVPLAALCNYVQQLRTACGMNRPDVPEQLVGRNRH